MLLKPVYPSLLAIPEKTISPEQTATIIDRVSTIPELEWQFPDAAAFTESEMKRIVEEQAGLKEGQIRNITDVSLRSPAVGFIAAYPGMSGKEHVQRKFGYGFAHLLGDPAGFYKLVELAILPSTTPAHYRFRVNAHSKDIPNSQDRTWPAEVQREWNPKSAEVERKLLEILSEFK